MFNFQIAPVIVKCAQTSNQDSTSITDLLTEADLQKGFELMWNYNGKDWPVTYVE